jgi:OmcA/MtrC family decaheme c-type cytochrome
MKKMSLRPWIGLVGAGLLATVIAGCGGSDGATGPQGPKGDTGDTGAQGPAGPAGGAGMFSVASNATTPSETATAAWAALAPKVDPASISVTIASPPVVKFTVTDADGKPVSGLANNTTKSSSATVASYPNTAFSIAKLVPGSNGSPSRWVSYIVTTVPTTTAAAAPTRPSTDNTGTLAEDPASPGSYTYTFYRDITTIKSQVDGMTVSAPNNKADLDDLTYDPSLVHRLTIQISGNAPGTGSNTPTGTTNVTAVPMTKPLDVIYDFIPNSGPVTASGRDIVANANCESCHSTLGGIPGDSSESSGAGFHGGARNNVQYCVVCHTEQRKYGRTEATIDPATLTFTSTSTYVVDGRAIGNLPNYIHKIHLGGILAKKNYNFGGVLFNEVGYPQDIRNCTKCHDGTSGASGSVKTPQGDNWKLVPSRRACGACHDGINFATGTGVKLADAAKGLTSSPNAHPAGPLADDSLCAVCHKSGNPGKFDIDVAHTPVTPPNEGSSLHVANGNNNTNAAWIASNTSRLPAGAIKVTYEIKSVSLNASRNPVMVFRWLQDGTPVAINDFATATVNPASGAKEMWDNFMGSPSAQFVWAEPQDGVTAPASFNKSASAYLRNVWNGTVAPTTATLAAGTGADAGYYVVTLAGTTVPTTAVMLTGGMGYSYNVSSTLPLTQTNLADYPVPDGSGLVNATATNKTGGLIVIAPNVNRVPTGSSGRRAIVEDAKCNKCHQELGAFTEDAFHGGQRNDATSCSWCHTPTRMGNNSGWSADSTVFVHAIHAGAKRSVPYNWHAVSATEGFFEIKYPGILARCEQCHVPGSYDFSNTASADAAGLGGDQIDKRLVRVTASGPLTSNIALSPYVTAGVDYGANGATTNLVSSPTVAVCTACHDTKLAISHMEVNGGSFYQTRATALGRQEQCLVCHASGRLADIKAVHAR